VKFEKQQEKRISEREDHAGVMAGVIIDRRLLLRQRVTRQAGYPQLLVTTLKVSTSL